jgi:hypothetical protein
MPITAFYSWQSDRDPKTNRYLVRDALVDAIAIVKGRAEVQVSDAERADRAAIELDHDTKGLPGTPDIFAAILRVCP